MSKLDELYELIDKSPRKDAADPLWLKREKHAIMKAGERCAEYFLDNVGAGVRNNINSTVGWVIGVTDEQPTEQPQIVLKDLPDIDTDFSDSRRHLVFEYMQRKWGAPNVSKMGNVNTLKGASVLAQVGKKFNISIGETSAIRNAMIEYSSGDARYGHGLEDTLHTTSPGQSFLADHPKAAECLADLELHPSHYGIHAAAILVCNEPIVDFCTVNEEGVAQIDKYDSEYLELVKIDALGLRTLGIIEDTGVITAEELYALPFNDPSAFDVINQHKVSDIFQFSGRALRMVTEAVEVVGFQTIDHITALARPGPLSSGMFEQYSNRAAGREPVTFEYPVMQDILQDTFGVILYQEQIMRIVREIGQFDWAKTSTIRKAMSGRKGEEFFNAMGKDFADGAVAQGYQREAAERLWGEMCTFGSWAFSMNHSRAYAIISYWCAWLKAHHPLEWAAANLRAAKDETQTIEILREMAKEGVSYIAMDPELSGMNWEVRERNGTKLLVGGIMNAKGYGPVKALKFIQKREDGLLKEKDWETIRKAEVMYTDLNEATTLWGHLYEKPSLARVFEPIKKIAELRDGKESVFICKMNKKVLDSENDPKRVKKRGGKMWKGPAEFLDLQVVDDSTSSVMTVRIRPEKFDDWGRDIYETAPKGSWWLVRGWKIPEIGMVIAKKMLHLEVDKHGLEALSIGST